MKQRLIYTLISATLFISGFYSGQQFSKPAPLAISPNFLFKQLEALDYQDINSVIINQHTANLVLIDSRGNARNIPAKALLNPTYQSKPIVASQADIALAQDKSIDIQSASEKNILAVEEPRASLPNMQTIATPISSKLEQQDINQRVLAELPIFLFSEVPTQMSLIYPAKTKTPKDTLVVFTDPSCPHCRVFHSKYLPRLLEDGYEVRYLPVSRITGVNADGSYRYNKQVEKRIQWALCLEDRFNQMDQLFKNKARHDPSEPTQCDESRWNVENNIQLSFHFLKAARGTPAIFSKNGYASNRILPNGLHITPGIPSYSKSNYQTLIAQLDYFKSQNKTKPNL